MKKKVLVISAINFTEGGPLTVLHNLLDSFTYENSRDYRIIVLINNKELIKNYQFDYIEFINSKKSWFFRLFYEYIYFYFLSLNIKPYIWFSLHDISPFVKSTYKILYCHNPAPFYNTTFNEFFVCPKFYLFSKLYLFLYKFNIKSNDYVIVQQDWLRNKFSKFFNIDNIMVSHPVLSTKVQTTISKKFFLNDEQLILLYPAFPRSFKNFEVVCDAIYLLSEKNQENIELRLTIDGNENRYARYIYNKYKSFAAINFIGLKNKAQINDEFNDASIIVFPSKLETWGLPISEAKGLNKPLLVSDLHYARETVGNYDMVSFLSPDDSQQWADCFDMILSKKFVFAGNKFAPPREPFTKDWHSLSAFILNL
jgi:hypothetical protein